VSPRQLGDVLLVPVEPQARWLVHLLAEQEDVHDPVVVEPQAEREHALGQPLHGARAVEGRHGSRDVQDEGDASGVLGESALLQAHSRGLDQGEHLGRLGAESLLEVHQTLLLESDRRARR
jgi:hypothetical protein